MTTVTHDFVTVDPYIKINLQYKDKTIAKWKSSIKHKTLAPVFNESFQFNIRGKDITNIQLEVLIMDHDKFSKDDVAGIVKYGGSVEGESERRQWKEMFLNPHKSICRWQSIKKL